MLYLYLILAIIAEVAATLCLKESHGFGRLWPTIFIFMGYGIALYLMTIVITILPLSVTYTIWSGLGLVTVMILSIFLYNEVPDLPALLGMVMIILGVVLIRFFSRSPAT